MNTIFEELGGTYSRKDGYLYPNITVPEEDKESIGKYGRIRRRYLKDHRPVLYSHLIFSGKLFSHLREMDRTGSSLESVGGKKRRIKEIKGFAGLTRSL